MTSEITITSVTIWSEGSRLAATLYKPIELQIPAPAILLCHGWGGLKGHLDNYARAFADVGFISLVFDYRGWGESDGKIIPLHNTPMLTQAGENTLKVRILREIVDPVDQVDDIRACLAYLGSEEGVDAKRIGLWGSSYGAGNIIVVAGTDDRVKAVVGQIGGYGNPAEAWYRDYAMKRAVDKARHFIDPPVPQRIDMLKGLNGAPDVARQYYHHPLEAARNIHVPTLIIDAEYEEYNDRHAHGEAVYNIVRENAPSEYQTFPCTHYKVYDEYYQPALKLAVNWFIKYL